MEGKIRNKNAQILSVLKFAALFNLAAVLNSVQKMVAKFATKNSWNYDVRSVLSFVAKLFCRKNKKKWNN